MKTIFILLLLFWSAYGNSKPYFDNSIFIEPNAYLKQLSQITDIPGSIARTFFSDAHKAAAKQLASWMEEAGMTTHIDMVGNVHGVIVSSDSTQPPLLIGSHYDTVIDGGAYDGALGIIAGISAAKTFILAELEAAGTDLSETVSLDPVSGRIQIPKAAASAAVRRPIHVVGFTDEEGVRFQSTFLGSRAVAGTLLKHPQMLSSRDKSGLSLTEVLAAENGIPVSEVAAATEKLVLPILPSEYIEIHMEQGPVLEHLAHPLGVVAAIAGQTRLWISVSGTQGHAGTVPMSQRIDAVAAAAAMVSEIERLCLRGVADEGGAAAEEQLVCTVGELQVWPGASNVISGRVEFSVDIRSKTDPLRERVVDEVTAALRSIAERRQAGIHIAHRHAAAAVAADAEILTLLTAAARESGEFLRKGSKTVEELEEMGLGDEQVKQTPVLISGAGHDAMALADVTRMAMLFVRCRAGISHSPLEHVDEADVSAAVAALAKYLQVRVGVYGQGPQPKTEELEGMWGTRHGDEL